MEYIVSKNHDSILGEMIDKTARCSLCDWTINFRLRVKSSGLNQGIMGILETMLFPEHNANKHNNEAKLTIN